LTSSRSLEAAPWNLLYGLEPELHLADIVPRSLQILMLMLMLMLMFLPCSTHELGMDIKQKVHFLGMKSAFAGLTVHAR
jgi:hypothetical protein